MPIIIDSHEDIAWNMLTFGRDYTNPVAITRQNEMGTRIPELNFGEALLGWPEYLTGQVAVIFSSLYATPIRYEKDQFYTQAYRNIDEAGAVYRRQLDVYQRLFDEHSDKFQLVDDQRSLDSVIRTWQSIVKTLDHPKIGLVLLMEGAECVRTPDELEFWWENGLRIIGPAWAGNQYCGGTREPGPLTPAGVNLLDQMDEMGFILDISHMDEEAVFQSLDHYQGAVIASHANSRALLKANINRFLSDQVIQELVARDGVIGVIPYNHHLVWDWNYPDEKHAVKLDAVISQLDYICQLSGDAKHVGLGSDFDGGIGMQSTPAEIDTIADLQKLAPLLELKGFTKPDVENIMSDNWLHHLQRSLP